MLDRIRVLMIERRSRMLPCDVLRIGPLPMLAVQREVARVTELSAADGLTEQLYGMRIERVAGPDHLEIA